MVMSVKMHQKEEEMRIKFGTGAEQKLVVRRFEASSSHPPVEPLAMPSFETAAGLEEVEEALGDHALDEIPKEHDDEFDEADAPWHAEYDIDGVVWSQESCVFLETHQDRVSINDGHSTTTSRH